MSDIKETLDISIVVDPNANVVLDTMLAEWQGIPYAELSVLLVHLKFLSVVHQTHHWISKGDPFYGDHILFDKLYSTVLEEIDQIGEKAVGLGVDANVNVVLQTAQLMRMVQGYGMTQTIPQPTELAKRSFLAEMNFLASLTMIMAIMCQNGTLTAGVENLLGGIADKHESHVYLLKQRSQTI